jgi:glutaminase
MQAHLEELVEQARKRARSGQVANYIPALAEADPNWVAVCVAPCQGSALAAGNSEQPFTLQSVSKVFALLYALEACGFDAVFRHIGYEPSGHPFYSLVQLEYEGGRPRNPLINAGAIAISAQLPGKSVEDKIGGFLKFLAGICGQKPVIDWSIYNSESQTGYRNRALANFMRNFGIISGDPEVAIETYFQQCSTLVTVTQLAELGLILACRGRHPRTGFMVSPENVRIVNALMSSCGLYDEAGLFAVRVGVPGKSGVSGGLLAIAPGRYALASFGPALNSKGNSIAGLYIFEQLSATLGLSLYL